MCRCIQHKIRSLLSGHFAFLFLLHLISSASFANNTALIVDYYFKVLDEIGQGELGPVALKALQEIKDPFIIPDQFLRSSATLANTLTELRQLSSQSGVDQNEAIAAIRKELGNRIVNIQRLEVSQKVIFKKDAVRKIAKQILVGNEAPSTFPTGLFKIKNRTIEGGVNIMSGGVTYHYKLGQFAFEDTDAEIEKGSRIIVGSEVSSTLPFLYTGIHSVLAIDTEGRVAVKNSNGSIHLLKPNQYKVESIAGVNGVMKGSRILIGSEVSSNFYRLDTGIHSVLAIDTEGRVAVKNSNGSIHLLKPNQYKVESIAGVNGVMKGSRILIDSEVSSNFYRLDTGIHSVLAIDTEGRVAVKNSNGVTYVLKQNQYSQGTALNTAQIAAPIQIPAIPVQAQKLNCKKGLFARIGALFRIH